MTQQPIRIVIAGGGTAGWMTAAAMSRTLGRTAHVTLVESDMIGTVGVGESTIPPLVNYLRLLNIPEPDFMRATHATFKLGIQFDNWRVPGESYFHSFGGTGKDHWTAGFQHFWMEGKARGHDVSYDEYCTELVAARESRFAHLPDGRLNYAFQLDATAFARFLRGIAEGEGTQRVEGKIAHVEMDGESGDVAALTLESGTRIEGDLFIDCTGFRALIMGQALHIGYDDWTHWLPCDSAIAVQTSSVRPAVPYTRAMAHDAGWQWRIPLQHRVGNGIVYCSRYLDHDAAEERLLGNIEGETTTKTNRLRFVTGARRKQWHRNCVAIGLSSGFMEPLESTSIHLIQRAIMRVIRMLPAGRVSERDEAEFNAQQMQDMEQIRDFLILHYKATDRRDSAFWRHCASMEIPDSLAHKIALFRETGRVFRTNEELFVENSWIQVMMGQGIMPQSHHPVAGKLSDRELEHLLRGLRETVAKTVGSLPAHADYVAKYCGAQEAEAA
ncbi:tryptophan halogenase family protein [Croceicoccus naphthovorans]|uniref:Tryptophan halogenase n=1 Tax=Croceicoccus naphthovorans TaxID=1348774 RepID=A0A0G3XIC8_9SPHN|nr:tryptophan halogenase family protein [Croceicoccus naphthovorans]AKM10376.1 tryptophan halogenase [Croceicoccus naphthovorans]MBB3990070.1 tryptophan halogenase [Croceicoccus naphthovorans]